MIDGAPIVHASWQDAPALADEGPRDALHRYEGMVAAAATTIVALVFLLGAAVLNLVMPYSLPGGMFLHKFHPASWLAAGLFAFVLRLGANDPLHKRYRTVAIFLLLLCLWLAARDKGALMATIVDTHFMAVAVLMALSCLPLQRVRAVLRVFVAIAALNVLIVALEFALKAPVVPREGYELFFRPAGLFGHPISAGVLFACAMLLVAKGVVDAWLVRPLMLAFLFGAVLCGVRGPLAAATFIFLLNVVWPLTPRRTGLDYLLDIGVVLTLPVVALLGLALGAFDRILALGVWEESTQSRFYIFEALNWLTDAQFWQGIDSYEVMEYLASQATGGRLIENSFVSIVFAAGLPTAIAACALIVFQHLPALRRSLGFLAIFFIVIIGTIAFSTKSSPTLGVALAGYWIVRRQREEQDHVCETA